MGDKKIITGITVSKQKVKAEMILENVVIPRAELFEIRKTKIDMNKETKFKVGDKAHKTKGYKFPCTIVGVFETIKGDIRVVGEMDEYGLLHIFNEDQLDKVTEPINGEVKSKWDL